MLQQCLPFTVLKLLALPNLANALFRVATVLTVYGIETVVVKGKGINFDGLQQCLPFTVLKRSRKRFFLELCHLLQQCLPFTVLKLMIDRNSYFVSKLQQHLPFTVLKLV